MKTSNLTIFVCGTVLLGACAEEPLPVSVAEFMENPRLLEATMVRCGQNRASTKYDAECLNARDAVNRLATVDGQERRHKLEKQSERKRQALRRTQEAAAEARRRSMEAQRLREEAEYLGLFEQLPPVGQSAPQPNAQNSGQGTTTAPQITTAPPSISTTIADNPGDDIEPVEEPPANEPPASDLQSIREELRRRREEPE